MDLSEIEEFIFCHLSVLAQLGLLETVIARDQRAFPSIIEVMFVVVVVARRQVSIVKTAQSSSKAKTGQTFGEEKKKTKTKLRKQTHNWNGLDRE